MQFYTIYSKTYPTLGNFCIPNPPLRLDHPRFPYNGSPPPPHQNLLHLYVLIQDNNNCFVCFKCGFLVETYLLSIYTLSTVVKYRTRARNRYIWNIVAPHCYNCIIFSSNISQSISGI